jgi:hypothetical protein
MSVISILSLKVAHFESIQKSTARWRALVAKLRTTKSDSVENLSISEAYQLQLSALPRGLRAPEVREKIRIFTLIQKL